MILTAVLVAPSRLATVAGLRLGADAVAADLPGLARALRARLGTGRLDVLRLCDSFEGSPHPLDDLAAARGLKPLLAAGARIELRRVPFVRLSAASLAGAGTPAAAGFQGGFQGGFGGSPAVAGFGGGFQGQSGPSASRLAIAIGVPVVMA
jgi:hypothetical protein